jgi:hypothetical protein
MKQGGKDRFATLFSQMFLVLNLLKDVSHFECSREYRCGAMVILIKSDTGKQRRFSYLRTAKL